MKRDPYKLYGRQFRAAALASCLKICGMTEFDLAFRIGTRARTVQGCLTGERLPPLNLIQSVCRVLHCSIDVLAPMMR